MEMSPEIDQLAAAMSAVQTESLFAITDSNNPFFNSKYADLSSVWSAIRKPLTKNGLAVVQTMKPSNGSVTVVTTLMHKSGQWIRGEASCTPDKATPQGYGSAVTYLRRYGLQAIVGVCPEDDDGNAAEGKPQQNKPSQQRPPQANGKATEKQRNFIIKLLMENSEKHSKMFDNQDAIDMAKHFSSPGGMTRKEASALIDRLNKEPDAVFKEYMAQ